MNYEHQYLNLLQKIIDTGEKRDDRTGVGTISLFGERLQFDVSKEFPLLTTKKMSFNSILAELIWFLEGSSDERRLAEILHGTRDESKKTIWSPNAEHTSGSAFKPKFKGDLGEIYGRQWRKWKTYEIKSWNHDSVHHEDGSETLLNAKILVSHIDQIKNVVDKIKNNSNDRRMIVSAWNPGELDNMALPPCHMMMQFYVRNGYLDCQMYQRSVDTFLGLPYNMASYAILMHIIANETGLTPGILTMCLGDTHLYLNSIDAANEQLSRRSMMNDHGPSLHVDKEVTTDNLSWDMFELIGYIPMDAIKVKMAA